MKKYEKPAIEEHAMGATMPLMLSDTEVVGDGNMRAPGKKGAPEDEDDNGFGEGW